MAFPPTRPLVALAAPDFGVPYDSALADKVRGQTTLRIFRFAADIGHAAFVSGVGASDASTDMGKRISGSVADFFDLCRIALKKHAIANSVGCDSAARYDCRSIRASGISGSYDLNQRRPASGNGCHYHGRKVVVKRHRNVSLRRATIRRRDERGRRARVVIPRDDRMIACNLVDGYGGSHVCILKGG